MTGSENDLIKTLKKGNSSSFELVFKTYYKKLCLFAFDYLNQLETAEDIVKDVFVTLWDNREKIEITTSLSGYLFTSVRNACINYLKRDKRRNKTVSFEELMRLNIKMNEPYSDTYIPGNIFAKELENKLLEKIEELPSSCKEIFKLSRFEGLSHKEIAEKLNISENTVKIQIYKALKKLKSIISPVNFILFQLFSKK
ncbi:MAG: RNA polymerase sigma-70 factor [Draconibacterium sp.]